MKFFKWRQRQKKNSETPRVSQNQNFYSTMISSTNALGSLSPSALSTDSKKKDKKRPQSLTINPPSVVQEEEECSSGTYAPSASTIFAQTVRTATSVASAQVAFKSRNNNNNEVIRARQKRKTSRVSFQLGPPTTIEDLPKKAMSECGTVSSKKVKVQVQQTPESKPLMPKNTENSFNAQAYIDYVVKVSNN